VFQQTANRPSHPWGTNHGENKPHAQRFQNRHGGKVAVATRHKLPALLLLYAAGGKVELEAGTIPSVAAGEWRDGCRIGSGFQVGGRFRLKGVPMNVIHTRKPK